MTIEYSEIELASILDVVELPLSREDWLKYDLLKPGKYTQLINLRDKRLRENPKINATEDTWVMDNVYPWFIDTEEGEWYNILDGWIHFKDKFSEGVIKPLDES